MKKVLIVNPSYLPGYKSGGPQQTIENICEVFKDRSEIYLLTLNHDMGEKEPYPFETNIWLSKFGIHIMYVTDKDFSFPLFKKMYQEFDTILACGLFCSSTIKMILINRNNDKELYIAPMGVFSKNALKNKHLKKRVFLSLFSLFGLFKKIIWSFTSTLEYEETKDAIGLKNIKKHIIAEDLPRIVDFQKQKENITNRGNSLRIIFLSRIVPKKNLLQAITILKDIKDRTLIFDIYGTKEDPVYWSLCEAAIKELPANISCKYCGSVNPINSINTFSKYDIFLFPTLGENFGHVIFESLAAGCVPVISDTTPWNDFDNKNCGSVIKLNDNNEFRRKIIEYIDLTPGELYQLKLNAIDYAQNKYINSVNSSGYHTIFI